MKTLIIVGLLASACGGSSGQSINSAGTWTVTDTLKNGSCGATATETLTVVGESIQDYVMTASYCGEGYCELQGVSGGKSRDVVFHSDGTAEGNRTDGACFYSTSGQREH